MDRLCILDEKLSHLSHMREHLVGMSSTCRDLQEKRWRLFDLESLQWAMCSCVACGSSVRGKSQPWICCCWWEIRSHSCCSDPWFNYFAWTCNTQEIVSLLWFSLLHEFSWPTFQFACHVVSPLAVSRKLMARFLGLIEASGRHLRLGLSF